MALVTGLLVSSGLARAGDLVCAVGAPDQGPVVLEPVAELNRAGESVPLQPLEGTVRGGELRAPGAPAVWFGFAHIDGYEPVRVRWHKGSCNVGALVPPRWITGRVVDPSGAPVAGATVWAVCSSQGWRPRTDADGRYRIAVPADTPECELVVSLERDGSAQRSVTVPVGASESADAVLP